MHCRPGALTGRLFQQAASGGLGLRIGRGRLHTQRGKAATKGARVCDQLCSARKALAAFCLSLPARNERGESRREGKLIRSASSPRPSPPFLRRRGRVNAVARSKQIVCRTQLVCDPQERCRPPSVLTNPARRLLSTCCGSQSRAPRKRRGPRRFGEIL